MKKLKFLREKSGMKQSDLADKLGVDRSTVAKWEVGEANPRVSTLPMLANALGCKIDDLFTSNSEVS